MSVVESVTTPGRTGVELVRKFEALSCADIPFAGGKGANLGELAAAGFPVPPGFVVGATAYAEFCDRTGCVTASPQRPRRSTSTIRPGSNWPRMTSRL